MTKEEVLLKIVTELIRTGSYETTFADSHRLVQNAYNIVEEMRTQGKLIWRQE